MDIEMAKVLMKDEWFSEASFNATMSATNRIDLPIFDDIKNQCEEKEVLVSDCEIWDKECPNCFRCDECPYCLMLSEKRYHFLNSPDSATCKDQISALKYFNII